jgi:hypothetical protein
MFHVKHASAWWRAALEKMVSRETSGLGLENAILQNNPMH